MKNDNKELLNLAEFKEKIRDVSKSDKENFIDSDIEIINFDKVKKAYCKKRTNIENTPKSNDGLYILGESMIFLEFKNANAKDIDMYDLSKKNYDSVCILSDIMGISIREIREKTKYILIYSSEKNSKIEFGVALSNKSKNNDKSENNDLENKKKNCFEQRKFLNYLYFEVEALSDIELKKDYLGKKII